MTLWNKLLAWFYKQSTHVKVAIVTIILGGPLGVATEMIVHYMNETPKQQITRFLVTVGEFRFPPVEKLTTEQQRAIRDMKYMTVAHLQNDTTLPLYNVVVSLPHSGIAEIVDRDNNSIVQEYKERVEVPLVAGMDTKVVYLWHKDKLEEGQAVTIGGLNFEKKEAVIRYQDDQTLSWYDIAYRIAWWCLVGSCVVFTAWSVATWFWPKKKPAAPGPTLAVPPPPSPVVPTANIPVPLAPVP